MTVEWWMFFAALLAVGPAVAIIWRRSVPKPPEQDPSKPVVPREEIQGCLYIMPIILGWMAGVAGLIGLLWRLQ